MLISIYLTMTISAFIFLTIGLLLKSDHKKGVRMSFPLIAAIIFGVLAFTSMNIIVPACSGQINSSTAINSSDTTYTSEMLCQDQDYKDQGGSALFSGLALISMIITFAKMFGDSVDYAGQQVSGKPPRGDTGVI